MKIYDDTLLLSSLGVPTRKTVPLMNLQRLFSFFAGAAIAAALYPDFQGTAEASPRVVPGIYSGPAAQADEQELAYAEPEAPALDMPIRRAAPSPREPAPHVQFQTHGAVYTGAYPAGGQVQGQPYGHVQLAAAEALPEPQQSALGGGFIEMLANTAGAGAGLAPPARRDYAAYRPAPAAVEMQRQIDPVYMRAEVDYPGAEAPGSVVIDTSDKHLYFVQGRGRAIRYGVGVGRPGFEWSGVKSISRKAEWPDWTPPSEMLARRPDLPHFMPGGPANPLGARALYLGSSLYRIHGTNEPHTIGQNVSSGCIRMMNEDVTDLYDRVRVGTRVVVR